MELVAGDVIKAGKDPIETDWESSDIKKAVIIAIAGNDLRVAIHGVLGYRYEETWNLQHVLVAIEKGWYQIEKYSIQEHILDSPSDCQKFLKYILDNPKLFAEWVTQDVEPWKFIFTMPGKVTDLDIEWARGQLAIQRIRTNS
jgi:hypothetical protein